MSTELPVLNCRDGAKCKFASEWCGRTILTTDDACRACLTQGGPASKNAVTASLVYGQMSNQDVKIENELEKDLQQYLSRREYPEEGPGTELKRLISWFAKEDESRGCKCKQRAYAMNSWGADGCAKRIDKILGWLEESANERGVLFVRLAAKALVLSAIQLSRLKGTNNDNNA